MIPDGDSAYLFHEVSLTGPLEELRALVQRKKQMHLSLGEAATSERLELAHQIARRALESALMAPPGVLRAAPAASADAEPSTPATALEPVISIPASSEPVPHLAGTNGDAPGEDLAGTTCQTLPPPAEQS